MTGWFTSLSPAQRGGILQALVLLLWLCGYELPAKDVLGWAPWPSTTKDIRAAISWWHPVALMIPFFLFVLTGHLDKGWKVGYLIAVAAMIVGAIVLHAIEAGA